LKSALLWKQSGATPLLWSRLRCDPRALTRVCRGTRAEHAGKSVAAADFRADDIALRAERFAQRMDLKLQVLFRHHNARPHAAEELLF
jgi:hypothetical protein